MKRVISKKIVALWPGGGLLDDDFFKRLRERTGIYDPYATKEDTGIPKKTILPETGFGSNDRKHNPGAGSGLGREEMESNLSLSSGYNDGSAADDEIGPGFTSQRSDPYYATDVFNELFLKLKMQSGDGDVRKDIKRLLNGPGRPVPHKRYRSSE